ncbi:MAG: PIN domain-containing protein [Candidatus Paceibacterota bacterium]
MILLDTDTGSLLASGNPKIAQQALAATDAVATTVITRVEILRARFAFLMKAADGAQLQRAQHWLDQSEADLRKLPVVAIDDASAAQFDKLRKQKKLKQIGRGNLLIASIAFASGALLVTRNLKHFRQVPNLKIENWAD